MISKNNLTITSSNPELGDAKEELDVRYDDEPMDIGFNARYIIEFLSILESSNVQLELNDRLSPGVLRPEGRADYTYVIMPMRI